jgi:hypothetical protein
MAIFLLFQRSIAAATVLVFLTDMCEAIGIIFYWALWIITSSLIAMSFKILVRQRIYHNRLVILVVIYVILVTVILILWFIFESHNEIIIEIYPSKIEIILIILNHIIYLLDLTVSLHDLWDCLNELLL